MSEPVARLLCETRRVFQAVGDAQVETLACAGVSQTERRLLEALARVAAPVTAATLARRTLTPAADILRCLEDLHRRGWIRDDRQPVAGGRVCLSDEGRAAWHDLQACERALLARLAAALDEQSVRATSATLRLLRRTLQRAAASC